MSRPWIILKFGGTSVTGADRWATIDGIVADHLAAGLRPVVVCSAMSGASTALSEALDRAAAGHESGLDTIAARHRAQAAALGVGGVIDQDLAALERVVTGVSLLGEVSPRTRARAMAFGELMSTRMGAAYLTRQGRPTGWLDARDLMQALPGTPGPAAWLAARCGDDQDPSLRATLEDRPEAVLITQGFIARGAEGSTVLLGRGGSDTSASLFAARLGAIRCEIWTDVPGMFSANPKDLPEAQVIRSLDYDEAQELASAGAKVLHPAAIAPVRRHRIPLHIRCTGNPDDPGTVIGPAGAASGPRVSAISSQKGITLVSMDTLGMWQQVGFLADVFTCFRDHGMSVDLVSTSEANVTVSLDPSPQGNDPQAIEALLADLGEHCRARTIGPCAAIHLVGRGIRAILHRLGPALALFEEQRIYLVSQAASDLDLTFVVDEAQADRLVRELHRLLIPTATASAPVRSRWWQARRDELLALAPHTPLYVYDQATIEQRTAELMDLPLDRVLYAMKANAHPDVLRVIAAAGLGFECVSPAEVARVLDDLGISPDRVLFTPNFAPRDEYAWALQRGVTVTIDNLHPLLAWPELFAGTDIFVRLDPGTGRGHHEHVKTAGKRSKFGIRLDDLDDLCAAVDACGATVIGIHAHSGSGVHDPAAWAETAMTLAAATARRFPSAKVLDLGGGLGVPERHGDPPLDLRALAAALRKVKQASPGLQLWMEPGRFVVAEAGVLLARVTQTKDKDDQHYVGIDAGMNSLIRPALYGAHHEIVNLSRLDRPATMTAHVVGPICESADTLGYARRLPETTEGDLLLIDVAGAYGRAMSSHYNLREPAAERLLAPRPSP